MTTKKAEQQKPGCPICGAPRKQEFRPFCSKRCADVDLSRWFGGAYRVPSTTPPDEFEVEEALQAAGETNSPNANDR